jgi:hypothetical protein
MTAPAEIIFDLRPVHVLEPAPPASGWICLVCFRHFADVAAACAVRCEGAA